MSNHHVRATALATLATLATVGGLALTPQPASATSTPLAITGIASVAPSHAAGNGGATAPSISDGGRFVAFEATDSDLVPGDTNAKEDVFVRDTLASTTTRVSVSTAGAQGNGNSTLPSISPNGRFVAFQSDATNLVAGDTNTKTDIFLRDLWLKTTIRVSVAGSSASQVTGGDSTHPKVSSDGNLVVFQSDATNVVPFDLNGKTDVFVRNISAKTTEIESVTSADAALAAGGDSPSMSSDGRYVVFDSSTNQIGVDTNNVLDVFLRDRQLGTTTRVSLGNGGVQGDAYSAYATVSDDGRYIAFQSRADNLTSDSDAIGKDDVYRRDRTAGTTVMIDKSTSGNPANGGGGGPEISGNGNLVLFSSDAPNLYAGDTNDLEDVFVRNVSAATTTRVSQGAYGEQWSGISFEGAVSDDGTATASCTLAQDAYSPDANDSFDIFWSANIQLGPFANVPALLQQNNQDFNGSQLSIGAVVAASNLVLDGVTSPASDIDAMAHGTFATHRAPVARLYWSFFHRDPDLGGLTYWVNKHAKGVKLDKIAASFASSSEFKTHYGSLDDTAFVKLVYQNVLLRQPDAAGLAHWVAKLQGGESRGGVMVDFSESSEGVRIMRPQVDTILVFLGMLKRLPTTNELTNDAYLLGAEGGQPTEVLINLLLVSSEYAGLVV